MPPAAKVPNFNIPATRAWGSVGIQPIAVIMPEPAVAGSPVPGSHLKPLATVQSGSVGLQLVSPVTVQFASEALPAEPVHLLAVLSKVDPAGQIQEVAPAARP